MSLTFLDWIVIYFSVFFLTLLAKFDIIREIRKQEKRNNDD